MTASYSRAPEFTPDSSGVCVVHLYLYFFVLCRSLLIVVYICVSRVCILSSDIGHWFVPSVFLFSSSFIIQLIKLFAVFFCNLSISWAIVITKKKGCYCHRQNLLQETITNKPPRCHSRSSTQWKSTPGSELWIALAKPHSVFVVDSTQYQYMRVN